MAKLDNGPARGTRDFLPPEMAHREAVVAEIASSYARFGFRRIETPALESVERLSSGQGGENEKLIYKVLRRGLPDSLESGTPLAELTDLALRYDLTVPLTRFYANNQGRLGTPFRSLQIGPVWRAERPAKGRYRQFTQCDIDVIGEPSVLAEEELLEASVTTLLRLGITPVTVRLNDRRLLGAIAGAAGVPEQATGSYFVTLDKLDKIGWEGVSAELGSKGFSKDVAVESERLLASLPSDAGPETVISYLADAVAGLEGEVLSELSETSGFLARLSEETADLSFVIDLSLVRGMGYYTGQIFEISHSTSDHSIGGGGRYDELLGRWLGRPVPACGFSIGFERVVDLASVDQADLGIALLHGTEPPHVVLAAARRLREDGQAVALFSRKKSLRSQLDALYEEGYRAFATLEDGELGEVRPLSR